MTQDEILSVLEANAYAVSGLAFGPTDKNRRWYEYIYNPQPGDLVLEVSTIGADRAKGKRFGRLVKIEREFVPSQDPDDEGYYDTFYHLELPDGSEFKWWNCRFVRVVESIKKVWEIDHS